MGKDNTDKAVNKIEPWAELQPYLKGAYADAQAAYKQGAPQYYGGQTVAPMSGYTKGSLDSMAQRASQGSPLITAAQGQLTDTLSGMYLDAGNPYFQGAIDAATRPVTQNYNDVVMPGLNSDFSSAGRYGSGAHALAASDMSNNYLNTIGDIGAQMSYQNYGDERQRQIQGMMFAPELANQDYRDIQMLGLAGQGYDQYNQALIDADKAKWDYNQNADMLHISQYLGLLNGSPFQTQTQKTPGEGNGLLGDILGTALKILPMAFGAPPALY